MTSNELPKELVWRADGHVDEVALTALADGETQLVPHDARVHAERCHACASRLAEAALLSLSVADALATARPAPARVQVVRAAVTRKHFSPLWPIAAALALAFVGALPTLLVLPEHMLNQARIVAHVLPALFRSGALVAHGAMDASHPVALTLRCLSAAVLIGAGFAVARVLPRSNPIRGAAASSAAQNEVNFPWVR